MHGEITRMERCNTPGGFKFDTDYDLGSSRCTSTLCAIYSPINDPNGDFAAIGCHFNTM